MAKNIVTIKRVEGMVDNIHKKLNSKGIKTGKVYPKTSFLERISELEGIFNALKQATAIYVAENGKIINPKEAAEKGIKAICIYGGYDVKDYIYAVPTGVKLRSKDYTIKRVHSECLAGQHKVSAALQSAKSNDFGYLITYHAELESVATAQGVIELAKDNGSLDVDVVDIKSAMKSLSKGGAYAVYGSKGYPLSAKPVVDYIPIGQQQSPLVDRVEETVTAYAKRNKFIAKDAYELNLPDSLKLVDKHGSDFCTKMLTKSPLY